MIKIISIVFFLSCTKTMSQDYLYILNDKCINDLITISESAFKPNEIQVIRDTRGILLRFNLQNPAEEIYELSSKTYNNSLKIKDFLAKIENPAIIEVHTENVIENKVANLKNWEVATIIANNIESVVLSDRKKSIRHRIRSVGYGEFLPSKNTPNNGGKYTNRVDIIILCNIGGE